MLRSSASAHSIAYPTALVLFDIDGVIRDVAGSYRRALADTVEHFTEGQYRPTSEEIDALKVEGCWNNDWEASRELILRFFRQRQAATPDLSYSAIVEFFQSKYRGTDFSGYIQNEPLLTDQPHLDALRAGNILWGFFSGATRGSASYVLETRIGLKQPVLVAMEDAPGKPDPTGLFDAISQLAARHHFEWNPLEALGCPILYVGDTVADMQTVLNARQQFPLQDWRAIGVIPPHVTARDRYSQQLTSAGAFQVLESVQDLTATQVAAETVPIASERRSGSA